MSTIYGFYASQWLKMSISQFGSPFSSHIWVVVSYSRYCKLLVKDICQ